MPSQYSVEMNLNFYKSNPKNVEVLKTTMHNIANQLKEDGWCAQKTENENTLNLRFWADNQFVDKMVEKNTIHFYKGFNGIMLSFTEKVFGSEAKEIALTNAKKSIRKTVENTLEVSIEDELSGLKHAIGFSVMKNDQPLFNNGCEPESQLVQPKKIKP